MKTQRWIDLSTQGIYLGSIKMADGIERLSLLDMNDSVAPEKLKEIGFLPFAGSPRYDKGIYYMTGEQSLRPSRIAAAIGIEKCPLIEVAVHEIDTVFRARCLEKFQTNLNAVTLRSEVLGHNARGDQVYQSPAGRFLRPSKSEAIVEHSDDGKALNKALFLRAETNEELRMCADGFVGQIIGGQKASWTDLQKFSRVVFNKVQPSDGELHRAQEAVEASAYRAFAGRSSNGPTEQAFKLATDFYYGLPVARMRTSESLFLQQYSTPMPLSVVGQRLMIGTDDLSNSSIFEPTAGNGGLVNMTPQGAKVYALELDRNRLAALRENPRIQAELGDATDVPFRARFGEPDGFDYTIANPPFGSMDEPRSFDKLTSIKRLDHYIALRTLAARKDHGRSVLILGADSAQSDGTVKGGSKHFLNYIHDHYEVHGCVEVDGRLYSRQGAGYNVRMLVIGDKLEQPRQVEVPDKLPILTTHDELWGWSEKVIAAYNAPRPTPEKDEKPEPQIGDSVFVRGGQYNGTIRTLLGKNGGGFDVSDTLMGKLTVPGVEFHRRPIAEMAKVGDRARFTAHDAGDPLSVGIVEGLVVDAASTSGGNTRYRVRTDTPSPQGGGNIEKIVYSHQGRMEVIPPQPTLSTLPLDKIRVGIFDSAPMVVPADWVLMNASRPLVGTRVHENGDSWPGRNHYAAIDPADKLATWAVSENEKLNAAVVLVASREEQVSMALVGSEYRDRYYSEMDATQRYDVLTGPVRRLNEKTYGEAKAILEEARTYLATHRTTLTPDGTVPESGEVKEPGNLPNMAVVRDVEGKLFIVTSGRFDRVGGQPFSPGERPEMSHEVQVNFDLSEARRNPEMPAGPLFYTGLRYEGDWENTSKYLSAQDQKSPAAPESEPDVAGFTRLQNGNIAANRAVFIPSLSVDDLESRLRKLIGDQGDIERLKDYKWTLLFDPQTADDKGFMHEYAADGGSVLVYRNKFWLTNIDERIAAFGGDPQDLTNNPLVLDELPIQAAQPSAVQATPAVELPPVAEPVEVEIAEIDTAAVVGASGPVFTTDANLPAVVVSAPAVNREPWMMTSDEWSAVRSAAKDSAASVGGRFPGGRQAAAITERERLTFGVTQWYHDRAKEGDPKALEWIEFSIPPTHRDVIAKAVFEKLPVPNNVMAEYPELAPPAPERRINEFQVPYQPASKAPMGTSAMIPINMAGSVYAALNDLEARNGPIDEFVAKKLKYPLNDVVSGRYFDAAQIDAIALGIDAVDHGRGVINADQTGFGKGRFVAAMMRYAKINEKTPIFLTIKPELFTDIFRDISDIGSRDLFKKLFIFNEGVHVMEFGTEDKVLYRATTTQDRRKAIEAKELEPDVDMVLATYSQFQRAASKNQKAQLLAALSQGNTMLFLDESHVASGASNIASAVGDAVTNCDGVVYSSATPLKGVSNFSIYSKVFPSSVDLKSLPDTLSSGGEALQEAISSNMARDGVLIRREHDFSKLTFVTRMPDKQKQERNVELANKLSEVLSVMSYLAGDVSAMVGKMNKSFTTNWEQIPESDRHGQRMHASSMNFGSRLYALNRQFLLGIKIDDAVQSSLEALQEGRKPVIAVENTGESLLRQVLARRAGVDELEKQLVELDERSGALTDEDKQKREELQAAIGSALRAVRLDELPQYRELLEIMLDRIGEIKVQQRYGEYTTERPSSEEYIESEARLRDMIREFPDLPLTPLDAIKHELSKHGFSVGEVSGRTASLKMENDRWAVSYHPKADAVANVAGFQNGKHDAIIITRSGSTGISLHATDRFADSDTRQRDFIVLQKASNIAEFLQWLGRVNRKDQVIEPVVTSLESGLPAELRLQMMHNAKLRKLSANTTSNRENENTAGDEHDLLNEVGDSVALSWLFDNPDIADYLDIALPKDDDEDVSRFSQECPYVNKLLGRLMMCDVARQQEILDAQNRRFGERLEELEQQGINPFKVDVYEWGASVVKEEELQGGVLRPSGSTFDEAIKIVTVGFEQDVHPIRSEKLLGMVRSGSELYSANAPLDKEGSLQPYLAMLRSMADGALREQLPIKLRESELSVSQILAKKENPALEKAKEKQDFLIDNLPFFKPGANLTHSDLFKGEVKGVVTAVNFPSNREDMFLLSKYAMRVVFPGDEQTKDLSLATLYNQGQNLAATAHRSIDLEKMECYAFARAQVAPVLREYDDAPDGKIHRTVHLLQGNIFRACELARQQALGTPILFTDAGGNRQRAVLLKERITPEKVKNLPIGLDASDMVAYVDEYLRPDHPQHRLRTSYGAMHIYDSGVKTMKKGEGLMFEVLNGGRDFRLVMPGTKSRAGNLMTDGAIFNIGEKTPASSMNLKLSGTRAFMSADIRRDQLPELMRKLQANHHVGKFYLPHPDQDVLKTLKERFASEHGVKNAPSHNSEPF
jgi:predicted RNA methylase